MPNCTNPSCLATSSYADEGKALDILAFVAFGLCLVLLGLSSFFGRRCSWNLFSLFSRRRTVVPQPESWNEGPVEKKAGLLGMKREERRLILEYVLTGTPYSSEVANAETAQNLQQSETNTTNVIDNSDVSTFSKTDEQSTDPDLALFTSSTDKAIDDIEIGGVVIPDDNDSQHDETCCSICLNDYEPNDLVVSGASCNHFFHTSCVLDWLDKHDHCPYCRQEMITTDQMKAAATKILGAERVAKLLAHTIRQSSADYGAASGGAWDFDM